MRWKPILGLWLGLALLVVIPWGWLERWLDRLGSKITLGVAFVMIIGVALVFVELMYRGLRHPPPPDS